MQSASPQANQDLVSEFVRLEELQGGAISRQWSSGLRATAGTLSQQPGRHAILGNVSRWIGCETRCLPYRRTPGSATYLLYYAVRDEGEDGPQVILFHIRHGARKPLTAKEARQMRGEV